MKVTAKQARERFSELLDRAARGEEVVILRRGRPVVRLTRAVPRSAGRLPDLTEFRKSIRVSGDTLTAALQAERKEARY